MKKQGIILAIITLFIQCKLETKEGGAKQGTPKIVCTTGMLGDAVKNIVGNNFEVISLMGPGVDPHLYKATQGDIELLSEADLIVYNGLHLEGKMGELFEKLADRTPILAAADGLKPEQLINNTEFQGAQDPHIWFDVLLWRDAVNYLAEEIAGLNELNRNVIDSNSSRYNKQLLELNREVLNKISELSPKERILITAHDAFGYFGRAYEFQVRGLQGISTVSEYGLKDVSDLVSFINENKIKAVFVESSVSDRSLKAVIEGCKASGHQVEIGGTLYSDAMGEADKPEGNYIGMVKYNVNTIVNSLKGETNE